MATREDDNSQIVIDRKVSITWLAGIVLVGIGWGVSQYYGYQEFARTTSAAMAENTLVLKELVQQMKAKDLKDQIQDVKLAEHDIRISDHQRVIEKIISR